MLWPRCGPCVAIGEDTAAARVMISVRPYHPLRHIVPSGCPGIDAGLSARAERFGQRGREGHRILNAGVHTLATCRAVQMGGVAKQQKNASGPRVSRRRDDGC